MSHFAIFLVGMVQLGTLWVCHLGSRRADAQQRHLAALDAHLREHDEIIRTLRARIDLLSDRVRGDR